MQEPKNNLDQLMRDPKAAGLLKQKDLLKSLMQSPDTQRLMQMLSQNAGDGLKSAASAAAKGDAGQLTGLLQQVMQSKEGAQLVERINRAVPQDQR